MQMKGQRTIIFTIIRIKIVFDRLMSATCFINIKSVYKTTSQISLVF